VNKSLDWLEKELERIKMLYPDDKIILNMHAILASAFQEAGGTMPDQIRDIGRRQSRLKAAGYVDESEADRSTTTVADYHQFEDLLAANPNIIAVFAGHLHQRVSQYLVASDDTATLHTDWSVNGVPVFFSGSAEFNKYSLVTFDRTGKKMTVQVINSLGGKVDLYGDEISTAY
jgi:hypothetical protein